MLPYTSATIRSSFFSDCAGFLLKKFLNIVFHLLAYVYLNKSPIIRFYKLRGTSESPVAFRRYDSDYHLAYIKYYIAKSMTEKETITVKL